MGSKKKMGRPTANPRINRLELRLSDEDMKKLEFCSGTTGLSKSDIIRKGIEKVYEELKK